jgi:hypothetical protein
MPTLEDAVALSPRGLIVGRRSSPRDLEIIRKMPQTTASAHLTVGVYVRDRWAWKRSGPRHATEGCKPWDLGTTNRQQGKAACATAKGRQVPESRQFWRGSWL